MHPLRPGRRPHPGRLRGGRPGRRPHVRRRGARAETRTSRASRSWAGRASCSTGCWPRSSASTGAAATSPTWSSADHRTTVTRGPTRSPPAGPTWTTSSSSSPPGGGHAGQLRHQAAARHGAGHHLGAGPGLPDGRDPAGADLPPGRRAAVGRGGAGPDARRPDPGQAAARAGRDRHRRVDAAHRRSGASTRALAAALAGLCRARRRGAAGRGPRARARPPSPRDSARGPGGGRADHQPDLHPGPPVPAAARGRRAGAPAARFASSSTPTSTGSTTCTRSPTWASGSWSRTAAWPWSNGATPPSPSLGDDWLPCDSTLDAARPDDDEDRRGHPRSPAGRATWSAPVGRKWTPPSAPWRCRGVNLLAIETATDAGGACPRSGTTAERPSASTSEVASTPSAGPGHRGGVRRCPAAHCPTSTSWPSTSARACSPGCGSGWPRPRPWPRPAGLGVLGVGSLDVLAAAGAGQALADGLDQVRDGGPVVDARRGEVFAAAYRIERSRATAPGDGTIAAGRGRRRSGRRRPPERARPRRARPTGSGPGRRSRAVLVVGDGAVRYLDLLAGDPALDLGLVDSLPSPPPSVAGPPGRCPAGRRSRRSAPGGRGARLPAGRPMPGSTGSSGRAPGADRGRPEDRAPVTAARPTPTRAAPVELVVAPMRTKDLRGVLRIEAGGLRRAVVATGCSSRSWPSGRPGPTGRLGGPSIVGFAGLMLVDDEAHVNNIAVDPDWRAAALGRCPPLRPGPPALERGARHLTLEVRVGNGRRWPSTPGSAWPRSGCVPTTTRAGEDALVMWARDIDSRRLPGAAGRHRGPVADRVDGHTRRAWRRIGGHRRPAGSLGIREPR